MSGNGQTLYLKIEQNNIVYGRGVRLEDVAKIECTDEGVRRQARQMEIYRFRGNDKRDFTQVFSVLRVIELLHEQFPELEIANIGAPDFVIRYVPDPEKKCVQYLKVAVLCVVLFFGSAFTIMTFIKDVSADELFAQFYERLTGMNPGGITPLEVSFCIGLAVGIMIFYNHVGPKKVSDDPTPIQVAMRKYEQDVDTTYIETSGRKGKSHDVGEPGK